MFVPVSTKTIPKYGPWHEATDEERAARLAECKAEFGFTHVAIDNENYYGGINLQNGFVTYGQWIRFMGYEPPQVAEGYIKHMPEGLLVLEDPMLSVTFVNSVRLYYGLLPGYWVSDEGDRLVPVRRNPGPFLPTYRGFVFSKLPPTNDPVDVIEQVARRRLPLNFSRAMYLNTHVGAYDFWPEGLLGVVCDDHHNAVNYCSDRVHPGVATISDTYAGVAFPTTS